MYMCMTSITELSLGRLTLIPLENPLYIRKVSDCGGLRTVSPNSFCLILGQAYLSYPSPDIFVSDHRVKDTGIIFKGQPKCTYLKVCLDTPPVLGIDRQFFRNGCTENLPLPLPLLHPLCIYKDLVQ